MLGRATSIERAERWRRAGCVSPLSAATLLLLVTIVIGSPYGASVPAPGQGLGDRETAGAVLTGVEASTRRAFARRRVAGAERETAAGWGGLDGRGAARVAGATGVGGAKIVWAGWNRVRVALMNLPPPSPFGTRVS